MSVVVDKTTGEVVERTTYQAFGSPESDYRPQRWLSFREDYRFTGKEDDIEAGLIYFGARYFQSALGRWISPDPLTIHGLGADPNPYAFVRGSPLRFSDPIGLQETGPPNPGCDPDNQSCGRRQDPCEGPCYSPAPSVGGTPYPPHAPERYAYTPPPTPPPPPTATPATGVVGGGIPDGGGSLGASVRSAFGLDDPAIRQAMERRNFARLAIAGSIFSAAGAIALAPTVDAILSAELIAQSIVQAQAALLPIAQFAYRLVLDINGSYFPKSGGISEAAEGLAPYEVGTYDALKARSAVGDELDLHHVVQAHPAGQTIPGYLRANGPSIALPNAEHLLVPRLSGPYTGTARDLLARDIRNLRNYTNAPNSALQDLIDLNKQMYPDALAK